MGNFGECIFLRETFSVLGRESTSLHRLEVSNRTWKFSAFTPSQAVGTSCGTSTGLVCDKNHSSSSEKSARPEKKYVNPVMRKLGTCEVLLLTHLESLYTPGEVTVCSRNAET